MNMRKQGRKRSKANRIHIAYGMYYNRQKLSEKHIARSVYFFLAPAFSAAARKTEEEQRKGNERDEEKQRRKGKKREKCQNLIFLLARTTAYP
jgi:hypothetical protein